jgi:hypothetical protein
MIERSENHIEQKEKDEAILNFVSRQAQDAILNPTLPDEYKDLVLDAALEVIGRVAESKAAYLAKYEVGHKTKKPRIIYKTK